MEIQQTSGFRFIGPQKKAGSAIEKTERSLSKILEQLSTAKRINKASDDAAGLGIAEQLSSQIRGFKMANQNVSDAMSALNIADGASGQVQDMLQRQRELALQSSNDTLTSEQRKTLDVEYQSISKEIDRVAEGTQFNKQNLTNGEDIASGGSKIQAGADAEDTINMPAFDMNTDKLGTAGTSIADAGSAKNALSALDTAINDLGSQRATLGSMVNRFQSTQNNLMVAETNTTAAESVLRDQDMASGLMEMTRNRLLQEVGTQAFQRFREISVNHIVGLFQ